MPDLPFTVEELVELDHPSSVQLSPDGKHVAFVMGKAYKPDADHDPQKAIYLINVETQAMRRLTGGDATNDQPVWSPDSRTLAFLSNRRNAKEMQLYVIDIHGGEAQALTDLRGRVDVPQWSPDGCWISFLYSGTLDKEAPPEPDPIVVDEKPVFNRIWLLNVKTKELRRLTPEGEHVFEYAWSPDSKKLVMLTSPHPNPMESWYSAQLHTIDAATGEVRPLCHMPNQIGRLTWSPDSQQIAFVSGVMSDEGNVAGEIYVVPADGGKARLVTPDTDHSITWIE